MAQSRTLVNGTLLRVSFENLVEETKHEVEQKKIRFSIQKKNQFSKHFWQTRTIKSPMREAKTLFFKSESPLRLIFWQLRQWRFDEWILFVVFEEMWVLLSRKNEFRIFLVNCRLWNSVAENKSNVAWVS